MENVPAPQSQIPPVVNKDPRAFWIYMALAATPIAAVIGGVIITVVSMMMRVESPQVAIVLITGGLGIVSAVLVADQLAKSNQYQ